jgi:hypothetical protein
MLAMGVVAALGLWAAGATGLPGDAFPRVVVATVVTAVGGSMELSGSAGGLAQTHAGVTVMPLSVTLVGAVVVAAGFLRPLRQYAVTGARAVAGWAARIAVLWLAALTGLAFAARQTFTIDLGNGLLGDIGELFGAEPRIGFAAQVPQSLGFGLLWLAGVLATAVLVTRGAVLPTRYAVVVRPAAYAMSVLLLACVVVGLVVALVTAGMRGRPAEIFALILLGLPNLAWPAFTIGLGATWHGRVEGPFGLPVPQLLEQMVRTPDVSTLNLGTLAEQDGRVWWLVFADAVLLLSAAFAVAARAPAGVPLWRQAVRMAVALVLTVLMICLTGRITAHYGLSLPGVGDVGGGLSGEVLLRPRLWSALGLAAGWGLATGLLGALPARRLHHRPVPAEPPEPPQPPVSPGPPGPPGPPRAT